MNHLRDFLTKTYGRDSRKIRLSSFLVTMGVVFAIVQGLGMMMDIPALQFGISRTDQQVTIGSIIPIMISVVVAGIVEGIVGYYMGNKK
ncbi:MAG: hypothetical protein ACI35O_14125 [Bacillaceae bacterium]